MLPLRQGMIHISELAWNRVNHPEDVVSVGQALKCKVLRLDLAKDRIDLSLKVWPPPAPASILAVLRDACFGHSWRGATRRPPNASALSARP